MIVEYSFLFPMVRQRFARVIVENKVVLFLDMVYLYSRAGLYCIHMVGHKNVSV